MEQVLAITKKTKSRWLSYEPFAVLNAEGETIDEIQLPNVNGVVAVPVQELRKFDPFAPHHKTIKDRMAAGKIKCYDENRRVIHPEDEEFTSNGKKFVDLKEWFGKNKSRIE